MKITFIQRGYESLAIEYLSAYLKKAGHKTSLVYDPSLFELPPFMSKTLQKYFSWRDKIVQAVLEQEPDLVAFSVVSDDFGWACNLAEAIKAKSDILIVFGGIHPTSVPERVIKENFVDYVCLGEGEEAMLELVDSLEKKKSLRNVLNIWAKHEEGVIVNSPRSLIKDLDELPFPDKDLFFAEYPGLVKEVYTIATSRGCNYRCAFCYNCYLGKLYREEKTYVRRRSVDNVIAELVLAKNKYGIKKIFFTDDLFISDKVWLKEFSAQYQEKVGLSFTCLVHPSFVDEEVVDLLEESGCEVIGMGIQSLDEDLRKKVLKRPGDNEAIKRAIELLNKTKIYFYVDMILGLPGQTEEELINAVHFLSIYRPDAVATLWLRYYPKIEIIKEALKRQLLSESEVEELEVSKSYTPLAIKGSTFNESLGKLGNLMLLSPLLPKKWIEWIIQRELYRYFPASTSLHLHLNSRIMFMVKKIFFKKRPYSYRSLVWPIRYYLYYFKKRFFTS